MSYTIAECSAGTLGSFQVYEHERGEDILQATLVGIFVDRADAELFVQTKMTHLLRVQFDSLYPRLQNRIPLADFDPNVHAMPEDTRSAAEALETKTTANETWSEDDNNVMMVPCKCGRKTKVFLNDNMTAEKMAAWISAGGHQLCFGCMEREFAAKKNSISGA